MPLISNRMQWVIEVVGTCLIVILPMAGFVVFGLLALLPGVEPKHGAWVSVALAFATLGGIRLYLGFSEDWWWLAGTALLIFAGGRILRASRTAVVAGLFAALALAATIGLIQYFQSLDDWVLVSGTRDAESGFLGLKRGALVGQTNLEPAAMKAWRLDNPESGSLSAVFEYANGPIGWDWFTESQGENLASTGPNNSPTIFAPAGSNPFIYRSAATGQPLAGRHFYSHLEIRTRSAKRSCGTINLAEHGASHLFSHHVCLNSGWQSVELYWTAPAEAEDSTIDIIVNGFSGSMLELRSPVIAERKDNYWRDLGPLGPTGVLATVYWTPDIGYREELGHARFLPDRATQVQVPFPKSSQAGPGTLSFEITIERLVGITIRGLELHLPEASLETAAPVTVPRRFSFWLVDANLAGHTLVFAGLAIFLMSTSLMVRLASVLVSSSLILLTGSRIAFGTFVAIIIFRAAFRKRRFRTWLWLLGLATLLVIAMVNLSVLFPNWRLLRIDAAGGVPRSDIWRAAWSMFAERPLLGVGLNGYASEWLQMGFARNGQLVAHAHNLILEFMSAFGTPGLVTIVFAIGYIIQKARSARGPEAALLVASLLCLQIGDYTLFHSSLLLPAILLLNSLFDPPANPTPPSLMRLIFSRTPRPE